MLPAKHIHNVERGAKKREQDKQGAKTRDRPSWEFPSLSLSLSPSLSAPFLSLSHVSLCLSVCLCVQHAPFSLNVGVSMTHRISCSVSACVYVSLAHTGIFEPGGLDG